MDNIYGYLKFLFLVTVPAFIFISASIKLIRTRRFYSKLPKPPHSFLWGHLQLFAEIMGLFPENADMSIIETTLQKKYNLPGLWYLDLWPFGPEFIMITDPELATKITINDNLPKHWQERSFLSPVAGDLNLVLLEGAPWKKLHKTLLPAFTNSNIRKSTTVMAEEVMVLREILDELATTNTKFSLETLARNLTFNVICRTMLGVVPDAQRKSHPILDEISIGIECTTTENLSFNPFTKLAAKRKRKAARTRLDVLVKQIVQDRVEFLKNEDTEDGNDTGLQAIDLIIRDTLQNDNSGSKSFTTLDENTTELIMSNAKSFILGGMGTTADTLCFAYMLLSVHPGVVQKLREEHNRIFNQDVQATYQQICDAPQKLSELAYTTNVIRETLRMYPAASTARATDKPILYKDSYYPVNGHVVSIFQHTLHYDPENFNDPDKFDPDRFDDPKSRRAWRPFERGLRGCIGEHLAMQELKIILLLTIRYYDFKCADLKPNLKPRVPWTNWDLVFGDRAFQRTAFGAKPRDGMPMTVSNVDDMY